MIRNPIPVEDFVAHSFRLWEPGWLLLTSGDFASGQYNCMTVSWGGLGILWGRPFAQVVVRPQRYTYQFIERFPTFTLCAFPKRFRPALSLLGTKSGRDGDKVSEAGITPTASTVVAAPVYAEAELVLECRKLYWDDLEPTHFLDSDIERNYPHQDYHRLYIGQILAITGTSSYNPSREV